MLDADGNLTSAEITVTQEAPQHITCLEFDHDPLNESASVVDEETHPKVHKLKKRFGALRQEDLANEVRVRVSGGGLGG